MRNPGHRSVGLGNFFQSGLVNDESFFLIAARALVCQVRGFVYRSLSASVTAFDYGGPRHGSVAPCQGEKVRLLKFRTCLSFLEVWTELYSL